MKLEVFDDDDIGRGTYLRDIATGLVAWRASLRPGDMVRCIRGSNHPPRGIGLVVSRHDVPPSIDLLILWSKQ